MSYLYYSDKEKTMVLYSIRTTPCECLEGKIVVYNVYDTDEEGLPVGHEEVCGVCKGKGYVVRSSEVPEAN
jgi:hypothetical protein